MQKTQSFCLVTLTLIAVGFSLFYLKSVLLPFVIAVFIYIGCGPVIEFLQRRLGMNRYVSFAFTFAAGTLMLAGFALLVWFSINDLAMHRDSYETRINAIAQWFTNFLDADLAASTPPQDPDGNTEQGSDDLAAAVAEDAKRAIHEFVAFISNFLQSQLLNIAGSLSSLLSYGVLILIFVFFLMLGQNSFENNPPPIIVEAVGQIRRYLVMKTVISALTGFAFGLVLWLFGVPLALLFGLLAFLLNFIPNIGPLISSLTPVPFLILNAEMSPIAAATCFLLVASIQFVSGNVVETKIMGQSFDVSPIFLLLALMFFGLVWGIIGMFLATPIVSIIKIILEQRPPTHPMAEIMAGRWPAIARG